MDKRKERISTPLGDKNRARAEEKILASLHIKCKECDYQMRRYRQDGKVYYHCDNCKPNRVVWIDMPEYLG
jgi:predicted Zn-ribbon and HTH transcriptional regulator